MDNAIEQELAGMAYACKEKLAGAVSMIASGQTPLADWQTALARHLAEGEERKRLLERLEQGKMGEVLQQLKQHPDGEVQGEATHTLGRLNRNQQAERKGISRPEDLSLEYNRILDAIQGIIDIAYPP